MPVTVKLWAARDLPCRPLTPLASESSVSETVAASEPAAMAFTFTLPERPAAILSGLVRVSLPLSALAATSSPSWKEAAVITSLVTARVAAVPVRTLPRDRVFEARTALA